MRATFVAIAITAAACTPDVVPGSYFCGPEQACPEGQVCNGTEDMNAGLIADTCMLPSVARPFDCKPTTSSEPDDTMATGHLVQPPMTCVGTLDLKQGCMTAGDSADWVTFVAPSVCTAIQVEARLEFSIANEALTVELWDADTNTKLSGDTECKQGGIDSSSVRRCLDSVLVPGKTYGVQVKPTGDGSCGGDCAYNRYNMTLTFGTPG